MDDVWGSGLVVFLFFVAALVTVMARASRHAPANVEKVSPPAAAVGPPVSLRRAPHAAMLYCRAERSIDAGKRKGERERNYGIDEATRDIMQKAAREALSKRADKALQRYAETGRIETDTDVYALLGVKTELGQQRLAEIRAERERAAMAARLAQASSQPREYERQPKGILEALPGN